ncbi:MAG: hypothetical protein WAR57_10375 [Candidatus Phosphoribacter sp.]|nr:hypothetical protein [Actinomycetales bacterium]
MKKQPGVVIGVWMLSALLAAPTAFAQPQDTGAKAKRATGKLIAAWDNDLPKGKLEVTQNSVKGSTPTTSDLQGSARSAQSPAVTAAYPFVCHVYAGDPYFEGGDTVTGWGYQSCSGSGWAPQNVQITIQRYRWWGWQNVARNQSGWNYAQFDEVHSQYYCVGSGTYDYRVVNDAWVTGGAQMVTAQSTHYYQVTC